MKPFRQYYFYGGIHPYEGKFSRANPIQEAPILERYTVPLLQHIGAPAKPVVKPGEHVLRGQKIGEPGGFISAAVHAPTSGTIKSFGTVLGPTGNQLPCAVLEADGEDTPCEPMPILDPENSSPEELRQRVADAGIVGMGGAAFPAAVKLNPSKPVDTLILNGVECEPYLTADHRLMLEKARNILAGAKVSAKILGVKRVMLAIEANKQDAVALMSLEAHSLGVEVHQLRVRYPQGAEKQLIYALTGRIVPSGGLPMDVGCVVQNVGTAAAIGVAVLKGKSSYERITTITGTPVNHPGNWRLRVGTSYRQALTMAGGVKEDPAQIISGGPMMGFAVYSLEIPVMKNTSGILLLSPRELYQFESNPCIRCGRCNDNCPMMLSPGTLGVQIENSRYELAEAWHVTDCIECGCCSYVCPAHRPLIQFMRRAKAEVIAKKKAALAKKAAENK